MVSKPVELTAAQARRFLVARQFLAPARALPARAASVLTVIDRLGSLQFDPLEAPGARNHELVLHARIRGFRRRSDWCERWLYGPPGRRRLFEAWNKGLSILPTAELAEHRVVWDQAVERYRGFLGKHAEVARTILAAIEERGPLATGALGKSAILDWWWGKTPVNRAVIDVLFLCGRLGIARRAGNTRHYDRLDRLLPAEVLARRVPAEQAWRHRLVSRVRGVGLLASRASAELFSATGTAAERRARLDALRDDGTLVDVAVDGLRGSFVMLAAEQPLLRARPRASSVAFLGPLDPLLWDRRLLAALWGFEYKWEVYTPAAQRRFGYYALPILWRDRLVGRIEPRVDRAAGALVVAGLWLEDGVDVDEPGFAAGFAEALAAYRDFVGAERVLFARPRGAAARELVRRVAPAGQQIGQRLPR